MESAIFNYNWYDTQLASGGDKICPAANQISQLGSASGRHEASDVLERLLFGAGNDFVLQVPAHIYKVVAKTSYPDDKVAMPFGILLGFP